MTARRKPARRTDNAWWGWGLDSAIALVVAGVVGLAFWAWWQWGFAAMLNGLARFCL